MTLALAAAERAGAPTLEAAVGAHVAPDWPPEFYEADDLDRMERLVRDPANAGWALYYLIQRAPPRTLVGVAGYAGHPTTDRAVEIGYSLIPSARRRGLATEAVTALLDHAFADPSVETVVAETLPELTASIGVLVRNGFRLAPQPGRGGALRYELSRARRLSEEPSRGSV